MRRQSRSEKRFRRFKRASSNLSFATGLGSLGAFVLRRRNLSRRLLQASAVTGLASLIPSKKLIQRVTSKRGRRFSRAEKFEKGSKAVQIAENIALLSTSRLWPLAMFSVPAALLMRKARRIREKSSKSRSRTRHRR